MKTRRQPPAVRPFRPKGHLSPAQLLLVASVACLPFVSIALRTLALPGAMLDGMDGLRTVGGTLNDALSLSDVPAEQRDHILYLLLLPTCALLVALARLTLGLRVLGFRSILIAVGFHLSGIVPGLLLIGVVVATVVLLRPRLRRIRLPYYARVSVILCIVALTMVAAVVVAPWMQWDMGWGVAYFPVIVLGMLAEGVARTLDRHNAATAAWRAGTTVVLGFGIALVCWIPALRSLMLQFPELVLAQIAAIVMVSECLDLRLLQRWDLRMSRGARRPRPALRGVRVALVCRRRESRVARTRGVRTRAPRLVRAIAAALARHGYTVRVLNDGLGLTGRLRRFLRRGRGGRVVFDLAPEKGGGARFAPMPSALERRGIAYVGATPAERANRLDRLAPRTLLRQADVPTPAFHLLADGTHVPALRFPALVRPRHAPGVPPRRVGGHEQLRRAVRTVFRRHGQEALVVECVPGRHFRVGLIGNDVLECLPPLEVDPRTGRTRGPVVLDDGLAERIRASACAAFRACACRDYARVDVAIDPSGRMWVLEVRTRDVLARKGAFICAGAQAGHTFDQIACRIVDEARARLAAATNRAEARRAPSRGVPPAVTATAGTRHLPAGARAS